MRAVNHKTAHLLQHICAMQPEGVLKLQDRQGNQGCVDFHWGRIVHATYQHYVGYQALYKLMQLSDVKVFLSEEDSQSTVTIGEPYGVAIARISMIGALRCQAPPAEENFQSGAKPLPFLRVCRGRLDGSEFHLQPGEVVLGRLDECQVRLPDTTVSGYHCRLRISQQGVVTVTDLNSANGTFINGSLIDEEELFFGMVLQLGEVWLQLQDGRNVFPDDADVSPDWLGLELEPPMLPETQFNKEVCKTCALKLFQITAPSAGAGDTG